MTKCHICDRLIPNHEPYINVAYQVEIDTPDVLEVDDTEALLIACRDCAPSKGSIVAALRRAGFPMQPRSALCLSGARSEVIR
jgi:hypothetical protein